MAGKQVNRRHKKQIPTYSQPQQLHKNKKKQKLHIYKICKVKKRKNKNEREITLKKKIAGW